MCGIYMTALAKSFQAGKKVFAGLKRIEYRGYDSWGVVVLGKNGFEIEKRVGKLSNLEDVNFSKSKFSLGHTRWATHGGVTEFNAHPHLAKDSSFALVQNGVVENYQTLKKELLDASYSFVSQTDTEVIVGLIETEMRKQKKIKPNLLIVRSVFLKLEGRNTIAILTKSGDLFAIRNGSPLVVGRNTKTNDVYFSSDVISMSGDADEYMVIQSGEMVEFKDQKLRVINLKSKEPVKMRFAKMNLQKIVIDKKGHESFMLKEIFEQGRVLSLVLVDKEREFKKAAKLISKAKTVFTLGAGTASFAAYHTAYLFRKIGINAMSIASYEADSYKPLFNRDSICIVYSQSGETADTNEVIEWMIEKGVKIISVVNMPGSTLTQLSNLPFMLDVGPELAVASTKAFMGHSLWGMIISLVLSDKKILDIKNNIYDFEQELSIWLSEKIIQEKLKKLAKNLVKNDHLFVLGRGDLYSSSLECALKIKEITYIHAEGFSGGELKHGVIALIEQDTPVICLVAEDENKANMLNAIAEVNSRGGHTIVIASKNNELFGEWIKVPEVKLGNINLMTLMSVVPVQLLTCYIAMKKKLDVDKPRNLAKSVTVK